MPQCETQSGNTPLQLSQAQTDALLKSVNEQLTLNTFNLHDQHTLKCMVESLGDGRGLVRLGFAEALGQIGKPATPFLIEALAHHPNPVVRRASAKTLTLIADPTAIPDLIHALLTDQDTVVQGSAIGALAQIGEASVPALLEILASPGHSESIKGHAAWALAFIGTQAKEHLYKVIDSDSAEVRAAVVGAIAKVAQENSDQKAYHILVNALSDPAENVRCEAAAVLGNLTYHPAIPNLVELLHHPDWESRKSAALALMKMGEATALEPLQAALSQEPEAAVQTVIKLAISQIEKQLEEDDWK